MQPAAHPVQIQGVVFLDSLCRHMVFGLHGEIIGDKGGDHQPGFLLAGEGRMFEGCRLYPGPVHKGLQTGQDIIEVPGLCDQLVEFSHKAVSVHVLLIVYFLEGYHATHHLLH